ncbi:MAG: hypothetical protein FJX89_06830 [Bacteroidetes bacterium]|nr:hypothetical protein [Bacteroidota bacterium]
MGISTVFISLAMLWSATASDTIPVHRTADFTPDGIGSASSWALAEWHAMPRVGEKVSDFYSRFRILYSETGLYILFHGTDAKVTSLYRRDFDDLYRADVFEAFFHTRPADPVYFEYEISPRNRELVLIIPNLGGKFLGWTPWKYDARRRTIHKVSIVKEKGRMTGWMAEVFIPFALLEPLRDNPPKPGIVWNANFCRLDYDSGRMEKWAWSPVRSGFHEFDRYRSIHFE